MSRSHQYNQKTEPKHCKSEVEEICVYQNLEWKVAVTASVYLKINSGFHARKNPKEQYLKVVMFIYVYDHIPGDIYIYTEQTISGASESFNIRQKLDDLFILGVTHISNLPTGCVKLMQVGGWV